MVKVRSFDAADHLDSPEMIAAYLDEASKAGDAVEMAMALAAVKRAQRRDEAPKG